jgi:hypothetical protein
MLVRRIGGDLKFGTSCVRGTLSFRCRAMISAPSTTSLPINLKRRTQTDDYVVLARAWKLANDKARELGWIV